MAEIDRNRDYYGDVRFDDTAFQLSAAGQTLQRKFVESFADQVRTDVEGKLAMPKAAPLARPEMRQNIVHAASPASSPLPQRSHSLHAEVQQAQQAGRQRIARQNSMLEDLTRDAKGASPQAATQARTWKRPTDE